MDGTHVTHLLASLGRWDEGPGPLYRQLAAGLSRALESGHLPAGSSLPPERKLAAALAVSRNTVSAAYAELRATGWVDSRRGSGTRVSALRHSPVAAHKANGLFATLLRDHPGVIDLTIAVPEAAPVVAEVIEDPGRFSSTRDLTDGHGYHPRGLPALRAALANRLTANGLPTTPDQILVTSGAQQGIALAVGALVRPGDTVAMESVTFPGAIDAVERAGGLIEAIADEGGRLDVDALHRQLRDRPPRLAYLVPTFHNPTGALIDGVDRKRLARSIARTGVTTIDDVTLAELDFSTPAPAPLAALEPEAPILTIGSMSKVFWGGLRVGWVRATEAMIDHLAGVKATADLGSSAISQALSVAMLDRYDETRAWRNARLAASMERLAHALSVRLPDWEWDEPQGGPHLWVRLPGTDATGFVQLALRNGVAAVAGPLLAAAPGRAGDRLRLPYYLGGDVLTEAVDRLATAWGARGRSVDLERRPA